MNSKTCVIDECDGSVRARNLCGKHYRSAMRGGGFANNVNSVKEPASRTLNTVNNVSEQAGGKVSVISPSPKPERFDRRFDSLPVESAVEPSIIFRPRHPNSKVVIMPDRSDTPCTCKGDVWEPNCRNSAHALQPRPGDYLGRAGRMVIK